MTRPIGEACRKLGISEQTDYYWLEVDRRNAVRVVEIVLDALRDPFAGLGKPEPLKDLGPGLWSRRLSLERRVAYLVRDDRIDFLQARRHH